MRRLFALVVSVLALVVASCSYDDTAIWDKLDEHEDHIVALEELCKKANSDIEALQTIVEALQQNDYVVSVAPVIEGGKTVGYTITFAKSGEVTIYNGKDGEDGKDGVNGDGGYIPNIGVKKDADGIYYWTLDGEWLLDDNGNKVRAQGEQGADGAQGEQGVPGNDGQNGQDGENGQDGKDGQDGVTPKLKIEDDYWYVSYDNGATWSLLGKATAENTSTSDSIFERVEIESDYVVFYLNDGSSFTLPINSQTDGDIIRFLDNAVKVRCIVNWDTDGDNELSKAEAAAVTSLENIFAECESIVEFNELKYFTGLTEIEPYAFEGAYNLQKITLPNSIKVIGELAFAYCYRLKQLNINEGVTKIGYGAFAGCRSLKSITIPDSVEDIQLTYEYYYDDGEFDIEYANPFLDCRSLEAIYSPYASDGRSLIMDNTLIYVASKGINEYTIPAEVKSVANNALGSSDYDYDGVRFPKVVIPESVEYIDYRGLLAAEYHFESMTPPSMHENALGYWYDGEGVRPVIYIPDEALGAYLASDWSERYKASIYFDIEDIPADNIIKYTTTDGRAVNVNIDGAIMHSYIDGVGYIIFPEAVTIVHELFGYYGDEVLTVTLPESVIEIGNYAFEDCYSLESINIPEGVISIGDYAFENCSSLTSMTIPDSVTTIGREAFRDCSSLTSVTIGDSVTTIGASAFCYCSSLTSVTIGDSVTTIGNWIFGYCSSLTSVTIGDSVTTIGDYAFYECSSLTSVTIPENVTSIGDYAFYGCYSLNSVYCAAINPPIGGYSMFSNNAPNRKIYVPTDSLNAYKGASGWYTYSEDITCALMLSIDKNLIKADGNDCTTLTVSFCGDIITDDIEFFSTNGEPVEINNCYFKTTVPGTYSIYAKYNNLHTNSVDILATDEEFSEYIALRGYTGDDNIECAVLGLDNSIMYYHKNSSNNGGISKISKYDNCTREVEYIINFDDEGKVSNILTPEVTIVFGNYRDTLVDAMVFTADGEREIIRDIECTVITRAPTGIEMTNLVVSGIATGLEVAALATGVAVATPLSISLAAIGVGLLAYEAATAYDLIDGNIAVDVSTHFLGHFGFLAGLAANFPNNRLEIAAALAAAAADLTGLAELFESDSKSKITIGNANLNPDGSISATLRWSGSADIDLHCDGPTGHICYWNMSCPGGFLDNDNTSAMGPETIYYSSPLANGTYSFYIHYYAENNGVRSVNYTVEINNCGEKEVFSGVISGEGSYVNIKTIIVGGIDNTRCSSTYSNYVIDWNKLPKKQ